MGRTQEDHVLELGPEGWVPSIPEPFWVRSLRTLFRWRPACYGHRTTFRTEAEYRAHWRAEHLR